MKITISVTLAAVHCDWQYFDWTANKGTCKPTASQTGTRFHVLGNGVWKNAFVYYISPAQIKVLTPPDAIGGPVQLVVTNNGAASAGFTAQALSPSFFVSMAARSFCIAMASAQLPPLVSGSVAQSGTLSPMRKST